MWMTKVNNIDIRGIVMGRVITPLSGGVAVCKKPSCKYNKSYTLINYQ